jgi:hypothetical protein
VGAYRGLRTTPPYPPPLRGEGEKELLGEGEKSRLGQLEPLIFAIICAELDTDLAL